MGRGVGQVLFKVEERDGQMSLPQKQMLRHEQSFLTDARETQGNCRLNANQKMITKNSPPLP